MKTAKYTASQIADWFLFSVDRAAGAGITHLKLQKLVYYAQAWSLALFNTPLFDEEIQAWAYGPVVPSLFRRFRNKGYENLEAPATHHKFDAPTEELLKQIESVYGRYDAKYLQQLTHDEDPWKKAREGLAPEAASKNEILKEDMASYYAGLSKAAGKKKKDTQ